MTRGSTQIRFRPELTASSRGAGLRPGEWTMELSTHGEGELVEIDWAGATGWALPDAAMQEAVQPTIAQEDVRVDPGLYPLEDVVDQVSAVVEVGVGVDPIHASRQVYINLPSMPAGQVMQLLADACWLELLGTDDGIILGASLPNGDRLRLHRANLMWLVNALRPLEGVSKDSAAARFAEVVLGSQRRRVRFGELPASLQHLVGPELPLGTGEDLDITVIPAFELQFHSDYMTVGLGFK